MHWVEGGGAQYTLYLKIPDFSQLFVVAATIKEKI